MTRTRRIRAIPSILAVGIVLVAGSERAEASYPTNTCVGSKQKAAGEYCEAALQAWSKWETSQNARTRDAAIARAARNLGAQWKAAESAALAEEVDCADTTLSSAAARSFVDSAIGAIVGEINAGLTLRRRGTSQCGRLLAAAALDCGALLKAEGTYIAALEKDSEGTARDAALARARSRFKKAWLKEVRRCSTGADEADIEGRLDGISAGIVLNTTVSPNVDDTQFTAYSATGPVHYLGRDYSPVCMNGSPYAFFAKRGSVNKLLVYYQGGGACWDPLTCSIPTCDNSVDPGSDNPSNVHVGLADRDNPANPFRDWNAVFVSYCSCDVHFGDAAQDYPPHVEHRGYQNSRVVEKWAREHFVNPETVFVTGSSAGAYGAWFNAPLHHRVWPASHFDVLADAGNGVITQDFLVHYFPNWDFRANIPPDIPGLVEVLDNGTGIVGYTEVVADFFPRTRWAHYTTAFDGGTGGQTGFYNIMLNNNNPIAALTWWNGSCAFNKAMRAQAIATAAAVPTNYRYYIGTGSRHTMFGSNKVYTDTTGGVPTIVDWINAMLGGTPAWTNVECTNCGLTLPGDPAPNPLQPPFELRGSDIFVNCPGTP